MTSTIGMSLSRIWGSGCNWVTVTSSTGGVTHNWALDNVGGSIPDNPSSITAGTKVMVIYGILVNFNGTGASALVGPGNPGGTGFLGTTATSLRTSVPAATNMYISYGPEGIVYAAADANVALRVNATTGGTLVATMFFKRLQ